MNDAAWTKHLSQPSFLYPSTDADIRLIPVSLCSVHYNNNYSPAESGFLQSVVTVLVETHWGDQCCVTSLTLLTTTSSHSACSVECQSSASPSVSKREVSRWSSTITTQIFLKILVSITVPDWTVLIPQCQYFLEIILEDYLLVITLLVIYT